MYTYVDYHCLTPIVQCRYYSLLHKATHTIINVYINVSHVRIYICDQLCETPPCLRENFDLILQFQNAINYVG